MSVKSQVMTEKRFLALILGLFVLLGLTYALTTPVFEASDELWHYPMVRHLADGNPLPVQVYDPAQAGPWKQEASQPPLYYYVAAALTFWIDTADMETIRWLNPHVDNGIITEDGNTNLAIHDPEQNPWQGTLLAVRIVRLASVLMSAGTVLLTYLIAKQVAPGRPEIALGATAVNAFLPMFLFISGAVNNDNLAVLLASLAVWMMIRAAGSVQFSVNSEQWTVDSATRVWYWFLLGVVIGLGVLTKQGTFALLPLAWGTIFIVRWQVNVMGDNGHFGDAQSGRFHSYSQLFKALLQSILYFALLLIPVTLVAGWWYWRNIQLYGDFLGWSAFIAVLGERASPASLAQLWDERQGFMMSFWGLFGGVNIPMPMWIYQVLNVVLVVSVVGFVVYFVQKLKDWKLKIGVWTWHLKSFIFNLFNFVIYQFGLIVCLLFAGAVVFGLVQWATTTWSSQGRLVFTAVSALCVLLVVGLVGWLPPKPARWVAGTLGTFMFVVAALAPWLWIQPAYETAVYASPLDRVGTEFGEQIRLVGYEIDETPALSQAEVAVSPGDALWLTLEWEVLDEMDRDWSVFVHLTDPVIGQPIAQRDMYPGQGLLATRLLKPGERLVNRYKLDIPAAAIAPADLTLNVGLYDYTTCPACERLPITDAGLLPVADDAVQVATIPLTATSTMLSAGAPGAYPNPISVNFGDELELVGYEIDPRRAHPGDVIELITYWRGKRPLTNDYTFFAQIVNLEDTTRYGSQDIQPPDGATSTWKPDTDQAIPMRLTLDENIPPGVYPIIIGAYTYSEDAGFERLQIVTPEGRITQDDFLILTPVRIDE
ncbi:MAG: glycosyltransferase family 39 protein [Anaerolineae bacterium]|nr:glycosyltransferase family 39 protein [Anaerolineae bacterium]